MHSPTSSSAISTTPLPTGIFTPTHTESTPKVTRYYDHCIAEYRGKYADQTSNKKRQPHDDGLSTLTPGQHDDDDDNDSFRDSPLQHSSLYQSVIDENDGEEDENTHSQIFPTVNDVIDAKGEQKRPHICFGTHVCLSLLSFPLAILSVLIAIALITFPSPEFINGKPYHLHQPSSVVLIIFAVIACTFSLLYGIMSAALCFRNKNHQNLLLTLFIINLVINMAVMGISAFTIHNFITKRVIPRKTENALATTLTENGLGPDNNNSTIITTATNPNPDEYPEPLTKPYPTYYTYPNSPLAITPALSGLMGILATIAMSLTMFGLIQTVRLKRASSKSQLSS